MLAARLRPNAMLGMMGARAMSTEIPINSVARIVRCVLFFCSLLCSCDAAPAASHARSVGPMRAARRTLRARAHVRLCAAPTSPTRRRP